MENFGQLNVDQRKEILYEIMYDCVEKYVFRKSSNDERISQDSEETKCSLEENDKNLMYDFIEKI